MSLLRAFVNNVFAPFAKKQKKTKEKNDVALLLNLSGNGNAKTTQKKTAKPKQYPVGDIPLPKLHRRVLALFMGAHKFAVVPVEFLNGTFTLRVNGIPFVVSSEICGKDIHKKLCALTGAPMSATLRLLPKDPRRNFMAGVLPGTAVKDDRTLQRIIFHPRWEITQRKPRDEGHRFCA
jgi:hypothetical protein